jgi:uncharacterized protein YkwD
MDSTGDRRAMPRKLAALFVAALALLIALTAASASAAGLVAPTAVCPDQERLDAPAAVQEQAMLCMANYARQQSGEGALEEAAPLVESARDKARDILACDSFSHTACGREFSYWMRETGYMSVECWRVGENLAWGAGEYGSVRSIFRAWMRSPDHRENILADFDQTGIDLHTGTLGDSAGTHVWAQHFGSRC